MLYHWFVGEGEGGFGVVYGQRTHSSAITAYQDQCLHY